MSGVLKSKMKKILIYSFILSMAIVSCRKDINEVKLMEETPDPTTIEAYNPSIVKINGSVLGQIVAANGAGIEDVEILLDSFQTTTNEFGFFSFLDIPLNEKGSLVTAIKEGYFNGSRRFFPIENAQNRIKIELIERIFEHQFESTLGGDVILNNNATIRFNPNSIALNGNLFNGQVQVAGRWLNPTDPKSFDQMPGNLQGVSFESRNEEVSLKTFGMFVLELQNLEGQELEIADTEKAMIKIPVPISLQSEAPAAIPLWSYSEEYGIWGAESTADLINGYYEGLVSHFSTWNLDEPVDPTIELTGCIENLGNVPLENFNVVFFQNSVQLANVYTNNDGCFSLLVPRNNSLIMRIYQQGCLVGEQVVSPMSSATILNTINIYIQDELLTKVSGTLTCDGIPKDNVLAYFNIAGVTESITIKNSDFEKTLITTCNNVAANDELSIKFAELTNLTESNTVSIIAGQDNQLGIIDICSSSLENIIQMTIGSDTKTFINPNILINFGSGKTTVSADNSVSGNQIKISFSFDGISTGNYPDDQSELDFIQDDPLLWNYDQGGNFDVFDISEYGNAGEAVAGSFAGTLIDGANSIPFSGNFHLIRN